jgi:hypothetical protein
MPLISVITFKKTWEENMVNLPLLAFSLLLCGSPLLSGCGVAARLQAFDINQRIKANASVARTAIQEHTKTNQSFLGLAQPPVPTGMGFVAQPYATALSPEDQVRLDRAKLREQELVEHDSEMSRIRRAHEIETEVLKHELLKDRLRHGRYGDLQTINAQLLNQYLAKRYNLVAMEEF